MLQLSRVGLVAAALVVVIGAGRTAAQEPAKPVFTINGDVAIITMLIKPDKTADFELVLARLREREAEAADAGPPLDESGDTDTDRLRSPSADTPDGDGEPRA